MPLVFRTAITGLCLALVVLAPVALHAATHAAASPDTNVATTHDQAVLTPVGKMVQNLGDEAIATIASKTLTPDQRAEKFRQMLRESFDLPTIGRFVIGRSWNAATPTQQQEYMRLFEALVIHSYGDRLTLYTGENFRVTGARPESEKDYIVSSEITHPDGSEPTEVDWRVRHKDNKYGIIDVVVEGISLSVTQRQEYSSIIQQDGGQLDGLLARMRQQLNEPPAAPPG